MHTIWIRVSNGSAMLSSFVMSLLALIALSSFVFSADPKGTLDIASLKVQNVKPPRQNLRREMAFVNFNMTADLTPLFNWNTKQLFLYVGAEFTDSKGVKNEVVIWDRIVRRKEDALIRVKGKNKYSLRNLDKTFKNTSPAEYTLKYNVMPYVGMLTYGEAARTQAIPFPDRE